MGQIHGMFLAVKWDAFLPDIICTVVLLCTTLLAGLVIAFKVKH